MDLGTKLRYQGCLSTPPLWKSDGVSPFQQIELAGNIEVIDDGTIFKNTRLGKLVEEFVFHQLKNQDSISWICDNLQVQDGKRTVGEIDALYFQAGRPIHLEVAYKFYLYDTIGNHDEPLARWIGPNRKDNLFYKLTKFHTRQFPLLKNALTKKYLEQLGLNVKDIRQELCFKAQLFLPYQGRAIDVSQLNRDCIAGYYLPYHKIELFKHLEFFVPAKLDWLVVPHQNVKWLSYDFGLEAIETDINSNRSPLVWLRQNDGGLSKCFIVFW